MKSLNYYSLIKISAIIIFLFCSHGISQNNIDYSIKKATLLSTSFPGLGQIYNKKYWKVPVIYIAIGGTLYSYTQYNKKYQDYKAAYIARTDNDPTTTDAFPNYTISNLITLQDSYRNSRDGSALLFLLMYILNIIDASVDAHLTNYNVNDNLSLYLNSNDSHQFKTINLSLKYNL